MEIKLKNNLTTQKLDYLGKKDLFLIENKFGFHL